MKYNSKDFKENKKLLKSKLKDEKDVVKVLDTVYALIPKRYSDSDLMTIGQVIKTVAVFLLIDGKNNYTLINLPLKVDLEPSIIEDVTIDSVEFVRATFFKGDLLLKSRKVLKDSGFIFDMVDDFNIKGKIPLFMTPTCIVETFLKSSKYLGSNIADNPMGVEIMVAINSRLKTDIMYPVRHKNVDIRKLKFTDMTYVGLGNVTHGLGTNIAKFTGRYYNDGLTSILLDEENQQTDIEKDYRL